MPYKTTTADIVIEVTPTFSESESKVDENVYTYSYTVTIRNVGDKIVQLINRHWKVLSGGRQIADVKGEGVIGQQPVIKPGEEHIYTSWTVVRDSVGVMYGSYTFYCENGSFFDVEIPHFDLIYVDTSSVH